MVVKYRYVTPAVASSLSVRLLGPLEVVVDGRPIVAVLGWIGIFLSAIAVGVLVINGDRSVRLASA